MSGPGPLPFEAGRRTPASKTTELLLEAADRLSLRVELEPEFGFVGAVYSGERRMRWRGGLFDINSAASSALTRDKGYAIAQLIGAGLRVPRTRSFFAPDFEAFARLRGSAAACRFARELGYPVFVKPNEGSQAYGALKAEDDDQLCWALERAFARHDGRVSLVQEYIAGQELRFLVLDGALQFAYRKVPLVLQGDGTLSLRELLLAAQREQLARWGKSFEIDDERLWEGFQRRGLRADSKPRGELPLADGLSLELGAGPEMVKPPQNESDQACAAMKALGLRYGSVDAIRADKDGQLYIIEVNSAPGVTGLAARGYKDEALALYCAILQAYFS